MLKNQKMFLNLNRFWGCWTITIEIFKRYSEKGGKVGMAGTRKKWIWESEKIFSWNKLFNCNNPEKPLRWAYDVSLYGLGAVLCLN